MTYNQFTIQEQINAAIELLSAEQKLAYYELIINKQEQQAFEYMLKCVFTLAAEELKKEDIKAYNKLMEEE